MQVQNLLPTWTLSEPHVQVTEDTAGESGCGSLPEATGASGSPCGTFTNDRATGPASSRQARPVHFLLPAPGNSTRGRETGSQENILPGTNLRHSEEVARPFSCPKIPVQRSLHGPEEEGVCPALDLGHLESAGHLPLGLPGHPGWHLYPRTPPGEGLGARLCEEGWLACGCFGVGGGLAGSLHHHRGHHDRVLTQAPPNPHPERRSSKAPLSGQV